LDFLGARPFSCENARQGLLDFLGFPWILSSESRLFNGLPGIFADRNFLRPFAIGGSAGEAATVSGMRKRRIAHTASLTLFLFFCKILSPQGRSLSATSIQKQPAPAGTKRNVDNAK
jgi:hypothetical protein